MIITETGKIAFRKLEYGQKVDSPILTKHTSQGADNFHLVKEVRNNITDEIFWIDIDVVDVELTDLNKMMKAEEKRKAKEVNIDIVKFSPADVIPLYSKPPIIDEVI